MGGRTSTERVYDVGSLPTDAEPIAVAIRSDWKAENRLHWCLDAQFGDDWTRGRIDHIAHNLALVRHMALNLIRMTPIDDESATAGVVAIPASVRFSWWWVQCCGTRS